MKFVDEALIKIQAGKGGDGSASFRREKYVPRGGPDGGDGGKGGSVYLLPKLGLNTLVDFRYQTQFKAEDGDIGRGRQCRGRDGKDCFISVPIGTLVRDVGTQEVIADLVTPGQPLLIAKGGQRGLGNINFKTAVNRAPRKTTPGKLGESRELHLELKLLAQVGLLGLPNAGKSTFLQAVSLAKPKIADYPFTTLHPQLGIVSLSGQRRFVIADIPGIIPGAAQGKGLGLQFLKHLSRTTLLLHLVDLMDPDPIANVLAVEQELAAFSPALAEKPRWIVFNKSDCFMETEISHEVTRITQALSYQGPVFTVSALTHKGMPPLCEKIMQFLTS